uniref:Metallo-beta-lactamase family protein n=1 Tax=uncultured Parcubacteria bacterium Rifle_16ft_4_minimus_37647 TaxID=1665140 RepID=A0A0H4TP34_9BACT|nr:metallo-beta-lactamase family protein [uncultured Parcubacteria bacterium Rifle_16ft_4_minimus_37647]
MKSLSLIFLVLIGFNLFVWYYVLTGEQDDLDIYFLDVGQGDSELVILPGDVRVLIDGGPDKSVLFELSQILPKTDRYIDLVVMTHAQLDHFGGLYDVVDRYKVGAFISTGREGESEAWKEFEELLQEKQIPVILLGAGDGIRYKDSNFIVLSPDQALLNNQEINESSLVVELFSEGAKSLFTGDVGFETENFLADTYDIDTDILKVPHHGSRFSSGLNFLMEATPAVSIIEVGKNSFGHPTEAALSRLRSAGSSIYRTDEDGTVHLEINDGVVLISTD